MLRHVAMDKILFAKTPCFSTNESQRNKTGGYYCTTTMLPIQSSPYIYLGWVGWKADNREVCICNLYLCFFSLVYSTPANSAASQLQEAWPASHYGHMRESADLLRMRRENQLI